MDILLAACESILGGAGIRLGAVWASYLVLKDGPPRVAARSSCVDFGSSGGDGGWTGAGLIGEAVAIPLLDMWTRDGLLIFFHSPANG